MNPHPIDIDDEGDINMNDWMDTGNSRASAVSTQSMTGLRVSSELMATNEFACGSIYEPDTLAVTAGRKTGFSYTSAPERDIFASKKGQALKTTKAAKFNGSIKTRDRPNLLLSDSELMNVYRFETHKVDVKPQDTAKLFPAEFSKVPHKFTDQDREINGKLKVVTGPALGYVYAYGEAQNSETEGKSMMKQIRKYKNGIAPLDKIALIEDELGQMVQNKGLQLSATYNSTGKTCASPLKTSATPDDLLPHLTRHEYQAVRKQVYSSGSPNHQGQMREYYNIATLALGESDEDTGSQSTHKAGASITITVPNSAMSAVDLKQEQNVHEEQGQDHLQLSNRYKDDDEEEEGENVISLADFLTPRSDDGISEKKKLRLEKQRQRQLQLQTVRARKVLRTVRKDPTRLANQLPRSDTGEYLVKEHALGKSNHLFEFNKELGGSGSGSGSGQPEDGGGYQPSFQHTKNKLLSKKDKIFLRGSEEPVSTDPLFEFTTQPNKEENFDILYSPSTNISVDCHSSYGPGESVRSMPSKYNTSKETLTEKQLTGKPHEIAGFIKTMVMKKEEVKSRLICFVCRKDALYFCLECAQNYCKLCWNSIGHHENMDPDEVWKNRLPGNSIEYNPNDERGMHVFLCPDEICQGKLRRGHTPLQGTGIATRPKSQGGGGARPRSPPLQSFAFPPPGGVVDYRGDYDWNTLSKKSKGRGKHINQRGRGGGKVGRGGRGGGEAAATSSSTHAMHNLITSAPETRPRSPPDISLPLDLNVTTSPSASPTRSPARSPTRSPSAQAQGNNSPTDSSLEGAPSGSVSPANSQSSKQHMKSPLKAAPPRRQAPVKAVKPPPVVMDPGPQTTLIWQVAPTGRTLCPVSSLTPGKMMQPARGITSEFFPKAWREGREEIHREFRICNGVTVASRTIPPQEKIREKTIFDDSSTSTASTSTSILTGDDAKSISTKMSKAFTGTNNTKGKRITAAK